MNIYEQHDKAFRSVEAYVVLNSKCERVATVAFKFAASGLTTTCFFHILGSEMTKDSASGGGYDKKSAAAYGACQKAKMRAQYDREPTEDYSEARQEFETIRLAVKDAGTRWDRDLQDAGFNVLQAV